MTRNSNFHYAGDENLGASLGQTLGRALFGDPIAAEAQRVAAQKAALIAAQTEAETQQGRLYSGQADGQGLQNTGSLDMGTFLARMTQRMQPAAPQAMPADDLAPRPDAVAPYEPTLADAMELLSATARAKGETVNLGDVMGSFGAFAGPEGMARRGMIANGQTPGENFALTPDRADQISARDASEDLNKAVTTENIQSGDRRYNTDRDYDASTRGQDVSATTQRRGQDITSTMRRRGQDVANQVRRETIAKREAQRSVAPISLSTHRMLFGDPDAADEPGELKRQLDGRGWKQTPDHGTMIRIRAAVVDRYRQSGNPVQAVSDVLDDVKRRWDQKQSRARPATQPPVAGARRGGDGKWYVATGQNADGSLKYSPVDG